MNWIRKHKGLCIFLGMIVIVAIAAVVMINSASQSRNDLMAAMSQKETAEVERRSLVESVSATGTIVSVAEKAVTADVSGVKIESVNVKVGDVVKEGDVLCLLDSTDIEENMSVAQTSLNSALGKTNVDVSSAERSLQEAQNSRNIETERASQDVADAWEDYLQALTDLEEAENDYLEGQQTTSEKNGEYQYRQELLEEAQQKMNNAQSGTGDSSRYETEFSATKTSLIEYVSGNSDVSWKDGALDHIYITNDNISQMTAEQLVTIAEESSNSSEIVENIESYLGSLKGYQLKYSESIQADITYQQAQAEYQQLQSEVTTWQSKYSAAQQSENSLEVAYEQAITAADTKLTAYKQKVRSQEDAARNSDTTVNNKEDSLKNSKYNAAVSGTSDKQQIKSYQEQIAACTVTAPISGVITEVHIEKGNTYTGNVMMVIEDTSRYEVSAQIDEYDIGKIKTGQKVVIKTNGTGDQELTGTVKEIAPRATAGAEVTYTVKASVDTLCSELKMDMTAKLGIILESKEGVLTVPYDAVQTAEDGSFFIEVIRKSETTDTSDTEQITVLKGIESDYYIEISGKEVAEGMEVVVPMTEAAENDIQNMMMQRGPMGGF